MFIPCIHFIGMVNSALDVMAISPGVSEDGRLNGSVEGICNKDRCDVSQSFSVEEGEI